jgi:hypothetical protein
MTAAKVRSMLPRPDPCASTQAHQTLHECRAEVTATRNYLNLHTTSGTYLHLTVVLMVYTKAHIRAL